MKKFIPREFEQKWQKKWEEDKIYQAQGASDKPKKYILDMFPYPSGDGLHVGHFKGYVASDVLSRYYRFKGFNVLHPMGWDAFGLPAENYAIKMGIHPSITTAKNIANIKKQMQMVSLSYDWSREINTTDPNYYKWTQWIFIKLFERGLAYEDDAPINWCPSDKTGLANEEVIDGKCARCGAAVEQKKIRQWILKITEYADRLLEDLEGLDWPEFIKEMQVNWIGRSEGTLLDFAIEGKKSKISVFTTALDTVFGVTFLVISPENKLLVDFVTEEQREEVEEYAKVASKKSNIERQENKTKTGVFTGGYVINPFNNEKVPVWVADYVLSGYGTGAVMGVPGHDARDHEFAKKYKLLIKPVIKPTKDVVQGTNVGPDGFWDYPEIKTQFLDSSELFNSGDFTGLSSKEAKQKMIDYIEKKGIGKKDVNYHLCDWIFSRQRYWGEPIPLVHCPKCGIVPVLEDELPLKLPEVEKYEPTGTGESPLAIISDWVNTKCPKCGGPGKRETNTMPQWAGSCWYYLRFIDPKNGKALVDKEKEEYWAPVDWYIGGAEHAVLHLLYARFWHKVLFDIGVVSTKEPFQKLTSVGLVLAADGRKMSKSLGNVITPDEIINEYGADTLRVYEAFMGPFDNTITWDPASINGVYRFLSRVWEIILKQSLEKSDNSIERALNKLIIKISNDIENMKFNTAVASMMEFTNLVYHQDLSLEQKKKFLLLLAPFAPHITEELWEMTGEEYSIHQRSWPEYEEKYLEDEEVTIVVQVSGRVRDQIMIQKDMINNRNVVEKMALASPKIQKFIDGKKIQKTIFVPSKIINFVV